MSGKYSNNRIVCVLGMHRSGTSALSKLITQLGFQAGDNLIPADEDNEEGYFEDIDIYRLNQDILSFLYLSWDRVEEFNLRKIYFLFDLVWEKFGEKAINIVQSKLEKENLLLIKDPRISILVPFWEEVFKHTGASVSYVLSVRNPLDVAKSLQKRNTVSYTHPEPTRPY